VAVREEEEEEEKEEKGSERVTAGAAPTRGRVVDFEQRGEREPAAVVPAAPSVRRISRELGVDIRKVPGTGPGGRISAEDVKGYVRALVARAEDATYGTVGAGATLPDFARWGEIERQRMTGIRRTTAARLSQAWSAIPHVTQHDKADVTELEALRRRHAPRAEQKGVKLTLTAIALKVVAAALKIFPRFGASIDVENEEIIYKRYVHLGVAVDTEHGLLVPVVRDVDRKNILEVAAELGRLAERARERKLTREEMEGATFTVTNLGGIGGTYFSPIVNFPEVAILGISRAVQEPVLANGSFVPRLLLPLSLSYDHRLIDGAEAVRFLHWVAGALEEPFRLSLEG
jgi:pyruvate dehydrogenase E2 component (dihydrolipoamide acetyltransferase)